MSDARDDEDVRIPRGIRRIRGLAAGYKLTLETLWSFRRWSSTGAALVWPTVETIAEATNESRRTIEDRLRGLVGLGWIRRARSPSGHDAFELAWPSDHGPTWELPRPDVDTAHRGDPHGPTWSVPRPNVVGPHGPTWTEQTENKQEQTRIEHHEDEPDPASIPPLPARRPADARPGQAPTAIHAGDLAPGQALLDASPRRLDAHDPRAERPAGMAELAPDRTQRADGSVRSPGRDAHDLANGRAAGQFALELDSGPVRDIARELLAEHDRLRRAAQAHHGQRVTTLRRASTAAEGSTLAAIRERLAEPEGEASARHSLAVQAADWLRSADECKTYSHIDWVWSSRKVEQCRHRTIGEPFGGGARAKPRAQAAPQFVDDAVWRGEPS